MSETYLSHAICAADAACTYDTNVKYLLADKQILAYILKYTIAEFQDMAVREILPCIGNDLEIGTKAVDAGLSNLGRVHDTNTEDNVPGEGKVFYDIRFTAYLRESEMKFLINVEAQKTSDTIKLGYHLDNRIQFYLSRMISAQKLTEFFNSDYDSLKKVRSIWICMDGSEVGDTIEEISFNRKTLFGCENYSGSIDLMKGIIVHIRSGRCQNESRNALISMLEYLLCEMDIEEKKRILTEKYGMIMTEKLEGRVQAMCNWSEVIIERGMKQGIEQGIEKGIEKGIKQGIEQGIEQGMKLERSHAIERMLKAGAAKEQIMSFGYTQEEFAEVENCLYANA